MPSVREILKQNDRELDISEIPLSFEFDGNFVFSENKWIPKEEQEFGQPKIYVWVYIFLSGEDSLIISPDDPDYVLGYVSSRIL